MASSDDPQQPEMPAILEALLPMVDAMQQMADVLEGQVTHLKSNGWTDSQARAIVATTMGWRET
jgi:hypothetical protein